MHTAGEEGSVKEIHFQGSWTGPTDIGDARREETQGRPMCLNCQGTVPSPPVEAWLPPYYLKFSGEGRPTVLETPAAFFRDLKHQSIG